MDPFLTVLITTMGANLSQRNNTVEERTCASPESNHGPLQNPCKELNSFNENRIAERNITVPIPVQATHRS